jgi:hypothetical protein
MSFRKYGGINYAAKNNIVHNNISNSNQETTSTYLGLRNSDITVLSNLDMSGNSLTDVESIEFMDGSVQVTAFTGTIGSISNLNQIDTANNVLTRVSSGYYSYSTNIDVSSTGGNITAQTFTTTSDYRTKENIYPLDETFHVDNLNPVIYTNKILKKQHVGLIAHELQEYYPYLVTGEKDGEVTQTINYNGLIGILIKEIQGLKKEIQGLKKEVQPLKLEVETLKKELKIVKEKID